MNTTENTAEKKTILVVDDTPDNIELLCGILGSQYRVKVASNGQLALKIASDQTPDLILLDVMMPDMNGYEVCIRLKTNIETSHIPVIFVTTLGEVYDEARGFDLGASDYIIKPLSAAIVRARVEAHLALADQRNQLEEIVAKRTAELKRSNQQLESSNQQLEKSNLEMENANQKLQHIQLQMLLQLGRAAEYRDNESGKHIIRIGNYSRVIGLASGFTDAQAEMLKYAAMLHDLGKIGIPDQILLKPSKLTEEELRIMKRHPEIGAEIIGDLDAEVMQMAKQISLAHHEKWNGQGYPYGLIGDEIPLVGRIVAIADAFDAMTSVRPYKLASSIENSFELLQKEAGQHFDPELVRFFISKKGDVCQIAFEHNDDGNLIKSPPNLKPIDESTIASKKTVKIYF